jgi:hypothetical protein
VDFFITSVDFLFIPVGKPPTRVDSSITCVDFSITHVDFFSTPVGKPSTHEDFLFTHVDEKSTHEDFFAASLETHLLHLLGLLLVVSNANGRQLRAAGRMGGVSIY